MRRPVLSTLTAAVALAAVAVCGGCGSHTVAQPVANSSTPTAPGGTPTTPTPTPTATPTATSTASPSASPTKTPLAPPVHNGRLVVRPSGGRSTAGRDDYQWVVEGTPAEQYTITELQGLSPRAAVLALGRVHARLGEVSGLGALQYVEAHSASQPVPCVVQVGRIGATTVLYQPDGSLAARSIRALGADGMAAYFSTDQNWDTKIQVVSRGRLIRTLDPFAAITQGHQRRLSQERGLGIGHGSPFAVSWALLERLSLTHISQNWLVDTLHATYVIDALHC